MAPLPVLSGMLFDCDTEILQVNITILMCFYMKVFNLYFIIIVEEIDVTLKATVNCLQLKRSNFVYCGKFVSLIYEN